MSDEIEASGTDVLPRHALLEHRCWYLLRRSPEKPATWVVSIPVAQL
jgi:hypothetical protein